MSRSLTQDSLDVGPLWLLLQDQAQVRAEAHMADIVQQDPDHLPGQVHHAAQTHKVAELRERCITS